MVKIFLYFILLIFEKFSNPPIFIPTPLLLILVTKTQNVQIFWTIFLANVITHYHYTVCKVYKQYIVPLTISRSIFERYFERKIFFKEQKVFKILILCLNAFDKRNFKTRRLKKSWHAYLEIKEVTKNIPWMNNKN